MIARTIHARAIRISVLFACVRVIVYSISFFVFGFVIVGRVLGRKEGRERKVKI